ncbi:MAG: site-specific DNA-methyltransferase, partial [Erysipelotrichaceae bacterium]
NNLLALSSLLERYEGKIKFITIDPPYYFKRNKSIDAFLYNSNYKLSTWLTFIKNRLELSKVLLSKDGIISIIIGEDGYSHLKLVCDEIFENENYITTISWRKTDNQSNIGEYANVTDYILLYKRSEEAKLGRLPLSEKARKEYSYRDSKGQYRRANILDQTRGRYRYNIQTPDGRILEGPWMITESEFNEMQNKDAIHWPEKGEQIPYGKTYLSEQIEKGQITSDFWDSSYGTNQRSSEEMKALFGERAFDFPKPELLLMNLLSIGSKEGDIVLDFFMGSATTQAVAMKMNRQFIGIEQMDYINTVSVPRLQKVIEGEQGGISKSVNWQGGGSFVYCELLEDNESLVRELEQSTDSQAIKKVLDKAIAHGKLVPSVLPDDLKETERDFDELSLEDQKKLAMELLDKNKLYINLSDIEDESFEISEADKKFTKSFYGLD